MYFVGFDPGGENAFGWAVVSGVDARLEIVAGETCTGAASALEAAATALPEPPTGIGIDAPLFWVLSGDRKADSFVREMVCAAGGRSGTVGHVNSLRGACLVQGVLAAYLAQERWPATKVSEAHPKALLAVSAQARDWMASLHRLPDREHVRDAALAAFSAYALVANTPGWHDLAIQEQNPYFPGGKKVAYYFPTQRS